MYAKVNRWGNSLGVRLPKMAIETLRLKDNDSVEVITQGNIIVIKPARITLEKIFEGFDPDKEEFDRFDWGELDAPAGRETI